MIWGSLNINHEHQALLMLLLKPMFNAMSAACIPASTVQSLWQRC